MWGKNLSIFFFLPMWLFKYITFKIVLGTSVYSLGGTQKRTARRHGVRQPQQQRRVAIWCIIFRPSPLLLPWPCCSQRVQRTTTPRCASQRGPTISNKSWHYTFRDIGTITVRILIRPKKRRVGPSSYSASHSSSETHSSWFNRHNIKILIQGLMGLPYRHIQLMV
jgi:hypothetical protein